METTETETPGAVAVARALADAVESSALAAVHSARTRAPVTETRAQIETYRDPTPESSNGEHATDPNPVISSMPVPSAANDPSDADPTPEIMPPS